MSGRVQFDVAFKGRQADVGKRASDPFRILVLGDFSGRNSRQEEGRALPARRAQEVTAETLDAVLAKLAPVARLASTKPGAPPITVRFAALEDFHPDRLLESVETLRTLSDLRKGLLAPETFAVAAGIVRGWTQPQPAALPVTPSPTAPPNNAESDDAALQRLMGRSRVPDAPTAAPRTNPANIDAFIRQIVSDSSVAPVPPERDALVAAVDTALTRNLRAVLHHPDFQSLEGAWRGLDFLVRTLELDGDLKLFILDVSKSELLANLSACEEVTQTGLYDLLVNQTVGSPGAEPWGVIAGLYDFRPAGEDADLLGKLAAIAQGAGAPFLAAADYRTFSSLSSPKSEDQQAWEALRHLHVAAWTGLATPRFLLRLPYGKSTDAIERFDFEEAATPPVREGYLWGNPALACACLLGQSFSESGGEFSADDNLELRGLPAHVYKEGGESKMTPCAEIWMSESTAEDLMDKGLMPFQSIRGRDAIRLARFQSIRQPATALSGCWNE